MIAEAGPRLLNDRYRVTHPLEDGRFEVTDFYRTGTVLVATLHGLPRALEGRVATHVAEERRLLSWLRHPDLVLPSDVFLDENGVWSVTRPPPGVEVRHSVPTVREIARWGGTLCEVLDALQRAPARPLAVRALAPESLRVTPERRLALAGFGLDRDLRVGALDEGGWVAPPGERADVWLVGAFLVDMLKLFEGRCDPRVRALRVLARRATAAEAAERPRSLFLLRRKLDRLASLPERPPPPCAAWPPADRRRVALVVTVVGALVGVLCALSSLLSGMPPGVLGGPEWVQGRVEGAETLVSPLGGHPCVAWSARLVCVVERRTWDADAREYRMARYERVLLERSAGAPFDLDGRPVRRAPMLLEGRAEPVSRLPAGVQERLRPGEHVVAVHGYEMCIRAGDVAYVHGATGSQGEIGVPIDGPMIVFQGSRTSYVVRAAWALLPSLLFFLGCVCALCIGGNALWRRGGISTWCWT